MVNNGKAIDKICLFVVYTKTIVYNSKRSIIVKGTPVILKSVTEV